MSDEQIKNLFEPFAQGDATINRRFGGTGLGLSIVKSLVEMMDGEIQVYSTAGEGRPFIVELSLEIDPQKAEYQRQVSSLYFNDIKTLVLGKDRVKHECYRQLFRSLWDALRIDNIPNQCHQYAGTGKRQVFRAV